eukprot:UN29138
MCYMYKHTLLYCILFLEKQYLSRTKNNQYPSMNYNPDLALDPSSNQSRSSSHGTQGSHTASYDRRPLVVPIENNVMEQGFPVYDSVNSAGSNEVFRVYVTPQQRHKRKIIKKDPSQKSRFPDGPGSGSEMYGRSGPGHSSENIQRITDINIQMQPEGIPQSRNQTYNERNNYNKNNNMYYKRNINPSLQHLPQNDGLGRTPNSEKEPSTPDSKLKTVYKKITVGQEEPVVRNARPIEYRDDFYQPNPIVFDDGLGYTPNAEKSSRR